MVFQHEQDAGQVGRQLVERHRSVDVALLALGPPDDRLVRDLLEDRGFPGAVRPEDLRLPAGLVFLVLVRLDVLDLLGELREVAVLGPLVVGDPDRDAHIDGLDDVGQLELAAPAALAALAEQPGNLLLDAREPGAEYGPGRGLALGEVPRSGQGGHHSWPATAFDVFGQAAGRAGQLLPHRSDGPLTQRADQALRLGLEPVHGGAARAVAGGGLFACHAGHLLVRVTGERELLVRRGAGSSASSSASSSSSSSAGSSTSSSYGSSSSYSSAGSSVSSKSSVSSESARAVLRRDRPLRRSSSSCSTYPSSSSSAGRRRRSLLTAPPARPAVSLAARPAPATAASGFRNDSARSCRLSLSESILLLTAVVAAALPASSRSPRIVDTISFTCGPSAPAMSVEPIIFAPRLSTAGPSPPIPPVAAPTAIIVAIRILRRRPRTYPTPTASATCAPPFMFYPFLAAAPGPARLQRPGHMPTYHWKGRRLPGAIAPKQDRGGSNAAGVAGVIVGSAAIGPAKRPS